MMMKNQENGISIHALREEGDQRIRCGKRTGADISIHALREEGDLFSRQAMESNESFLSTPSARRATGDALHDRIDIAISIHALREEGDRYPRHAFPGPCDFYPRPPRGGRPRRQLWKMWSKPFLSTPSARRATVHKRTPWTVRRYFYPRPPRGGRPAPCCKGADQSQNFYPRPPRGGRPLT